MHVHEDVVLIILHCTVLLYFLCVHEDVVLIILHYTMILHLLYLMHVHEDVVLVPVDAQQADEGLVLRIRQHGAKDLVRARSNVLGACACDWATSNRCGVVVEDTVSRSTTGLLE